MAGFPKLRLRRLRRTEALRALVRENRVEVGDLIYPMFVVEGKGIKQEITSMPDVFRYSPDQLSREVEEVAGLKLPAVLLFGIPDHKDETGSSAYHPDGVVQKAIRAIKSTVPELLVITDVCLCEYTSHGHCGVIASGDVDNNQTLPLLARMALSHVEAGADIVAPSDMMDGRVKAIREILDEKGYQHIPIYPTSPSMRRHSTDHSGKQRNPLPSLVIAAPTRWIRPTCVRHYERWNRILWKVPISLWLNLP